MGGGLGGGGGDGDREPKEPGVISGPRLRIPVQSDPKRIRLVD